jgi:hypothetical protein
MAEACSSKPGVSTTKKTIHKIFGTSDRNQELILASGQVRSFYNQPDLGPDPRGRPKMILYQNIIIIRDYFDDPEIPFDNKGKP